MHQVKAWTAINRLSIIWKSNLSNKMKCNFFQAVIVSILQNGCTQSWKQHPMKQQMFGHLPPISKNIQIRQTRHSEHRWRSKDEFISDILQWTPSHRHASVGRLTRIYLQQLYKDTRWSLEDQSEAMDDRDEWQERFMLFFSSSLTLIWKILIFFPKFYEKGF